ncbi:MAG: AAA family ATPase [Planctomycetes bacterium]|nr:AAA family ATPase [Planctomycetota bacterium]
MNVDQRNHLFLVGPIDRDDLWPKVTEYQAQRFQFRWEFGLDQLPAKPGLITIRGARQVGKSTWLELQLLSTLEDHGLGSAFLLSGDYTLTMDDFERKLLELEGSFPRTARIKRIFVDEVTQIPHWERAFKRLFDSGHLRDILVVTTGSNAADLRHGSERLPGRKGSLSRSDYLFLPITYKEYRHQVGNDIGMTEQDFFWGYLLSGGSPLGIQSVYQSERLDDTFASLMQDWILGTFAASGRSRMLLFNLLQKLYQSAPAAISYTKLAKEAGLANNSAALDYVEKLADLLCIAPMLAWDADRKVSLSRKPSKFPFINLAAAWIFHPQSPRYIHELKALEGVEKAALYEWAVAQELWRRSRLQEQSSPPGKPKELFYWASKEHEIDFVVAGEQFFEVKSGPTNPAEFSWFPKIFGKRKLQIISEVDFETDPLRSTTLERFLLEAPSNLQYFD